MIPKKVSESNFAKTARFVKSLPSSDFWVSSLKASKNAEKKFGYNTGILGIFTAIKLRKYRGFDDSRGGFF